MILKGKTAIITGSNSGIGLGVAEELAKSGADVVLNSFTDRPEDHDLAIRDWQEVRRERPAISRPTCRKGPSAGR
jgi:NAD(P)-dependent dehydrogenase (short-subunit alcohol dehydrogenase family)